CVAKRYAKEQGTDMNSRGSDYTERLRAAARGGYAIGAFNVDSLDVLGLLVGHVAGTQSPAIFQFGPWSFSHLPIRPTTAAARALTENAAACFVHLDHCKDIDVLGRCVEAGFDSVMFDGTDLPLEENIARTREAVELGHAAGAAVEGAVGQLERGADTDPAEAEPFVRRTGVDALGVAIGTGHGQQRAPEQIDLARLDALSEMGVPLVIHGGSGLPPDVMPAVRRSAVAKINVATACYRSAQAAVEHFLQEKGQGRIL
ncbi:unnamed protein product, partial [marine sediment metagenome]